MDRASSRVMPEDMPGGGGCEVDHPRPSFRTLDDDGGAVSEVGMASHLDFGTEVGDE